MYIALSFHVIWLVINAQILELRIVMMQLKWDIPCLRLLLRPKEGIDSNQLLLDFFLCIQNILFILLIFLGLAL